MFLENWKHQFKRTLSWIVSNEQNRKMLVSNCAICNKMNSRFIKNQEASGLFSKFVYSFIQKSTFKALILIIFEMTSLKWMKSITNVTD